MKKIFVLVVTIFSILGFYNLNAAECSDDTLKDASKVKVEAKAITGEQIYYQIIISNITPNIYVEVYEDDNKTTTKYTSDNAVNGVVTIDQWFIFGKVNYTVKVYGVGESCTEELNTLNASTKRFNEKNNYTVCQENPEYEKCKPFYVPTTKEEINQTEEEFFEEIEEYIEIKNETIPEKLLRWVKEYYLYALIPFSVIALIYVTLIIIYKRKRSEAR